MDISAEDSYQSDEESVKQQIKKEKEMAAKQVIDPIAELFRKQVEEMSKPNMLSQSVVMRPCSIIVLMSILMLVIYFLAGTN